MTGQLGGGAGRPAVALPRPTANGVALLLLALGLAFSGWWAQTPDLIAVALLLAVLLLVGVLAAASPRPARRAHVTREVAGQLVCGQPAVISTAVEGLSRGGLARVGHLQDALPPTFAWGGRGGSGPGECGAGAANQVWNDGANDGANDARSDAVSDAAQSACTDGARHTYRITPKQAGYFRLGPATCRVTDPIGAVASERRLDPGTEVVVWPRTVPLNTAGAFGAALTGAGFAAADAADDAVLRDYVPGDDLRRVHWPTSARRGHPVVRAAEGRAVAPVQLYLDPALLKQPAALRWSLEHLGSLGTSLLRSGHPVRVLGAGTPEFITCRETGRRAVLNHTSQLASAHRDDRLALQQLGRTRPGVVTIAVVTPQHQLPASLAGGRRHALVMGGGRGAGAQCAQQLTRAGWRAAVVGPDWSHAQAWAAVSGLAS